MSHVGRPSNEELKKRKIKRVLKVVFPLMCLLLVVVAVFLFFSNNLGKTLNNSSTRNLSAIKGYSCDNGYTLNGNKCVKTIKVAPTLLGDIDLDGKLTVNDVKLMSDYLDTESIDLSNLQFKAGDIDNSGEITYVDLRILSLYFEDNPTLGTYEMYYDKVGVKKLCEQGYSLKNNSCVKTASKDANLTNLIEVDIKDDQNNLVNLKSDTTVNLVTTFKVNDLSKNYYYVWRTYKNGSLLNTGTCKKISVNDNKTATAKTILKMVGTRKGIFTIYSDASCKTKISDVSTKEYKCNDCKVTVTLNDNSSSDTKVLNWVQTKKFTAKVSTPSSTKYYYTWKDSSQKNAGKCSVLKKDMTLSLNVNSKKYGTFTVYSDSNCKKKVVSKNTSTYSLANMIWPVEPKFNLLTHDKKIYREKHYVYGNKSEWHEGLDITVPIGTPVYAIADGTVRYTNTYSGKYKDEDYGNVIFITTKINNKNYSVAYAHLRDLPTKYVKVGQKVKKGQLIGYSGITGGSRIPHLHIDMSLLGGGGLLDPLNVLPKVDFSKLKSSIGENDYSKEQFPKSSVDLFNRMMKAQKSGKAFSYKIEGIAKVKVGSIPKGATVELIRRSRDYSSLVNVKYNGKTYTNLNAGNFKFIW